MNKSLYRKINNQKSYFKMSILILFLVFTPNSHLQAEEIAPIKPEEVITNESSNIRTELKKVYQLDFSNGDVILNPRVVSFPVTQLISGYGRITNNNSNMIKSAAMADLTRNYLGFAEGLSYQISENELTIKSSDNINFDKTEIQEKSLADNVYSLTKKFTLTDKIKKHKEDLPYLISIGEAEIKNGDIIGAYNQAKNIAINKGLKSFYKNDLKILKSGKIYLQNILYNSFDNENFSNLTSYIYIVQFSIQDKK